MSKPASDRHIGLAVTHGNGGLMRHVSGISAGQIDGVIVLERNRW